MGRLIISPTYESSWVNEEVNKIDSLAKSLSNPQ